MSFDLDPDDDDLDFDVDDLSMIPIPSSDLQATYLRTTVEKKPLKSKLRQSTPVKALLSVRKKVGELSAKYPTAIRHGITICESVIDFYRRRNYFTIARGAFQIFETIQSSNLYSFHQFARSTDGFRYLAVNRVNVGFLFKDTLEKFAKIKITFKNGETADSIHLEGVGEIYLYAVGTETYVYYNSGQVDKDELTNFLVSEKFRDLDSNFLYLQTKENEPGLTLSAWKPTLLPSKNAEAIGKMLRKFNGVGINRSILLFGSPGVGKSSMSFKILSDLQYRTIVFSASNKLVSFDLIKNLIDMLSIDAIIIDDFDQFTASNKTLDILEMFNRKCKVLIGIANTLKEFNVAILRPGRFDEVILVDQLDEECIRGVLGKHTKAYLDRCRKWPIAFIVEFVKKSQFLTTKKERDDYATDLEHRIIRQVGAYAIFRPAPKKRGRPSKKAAALASKAPIFAAMNEMHDDEMMDDDDDIWDDEFFDELEEFE